jgi:hypothetical protein
MIDFANALKTEEARGEYATALAKRITSIVMTEAKENAMPYHKVDWMRLREWDKKFIRDTNLFERGDITKQTLDDTSTLLLKEWRTILKEFKASRREAVNVAHPSF